MTSKNTFSLESHAGYAAANRKLAEFRVELTRAEGELVRIENLLRAARQTSGIDAEAAARLTGGSVPAVADTSQEQFARARRNVEVLGRTVNLQEEIVARERQRGSVGICAELKPEYARIARQLGLAVLALGKGAEAEIRFINDLEQDGIMCYLPRMVFSCAGNPAVYGSRIQTFLMQAVVEGFLRRDEIPESWLASWGCYLDREIADREAAVAVAPTPRKSFAQA